MSSHPRIHVLTTARGNDFMLDIARMVEHGFRMAGAVVELHIDESPVSIDDAWSIVVAPHEFFPLYLEPSIGKARAAAIAQDVIVLNVEQPGSTWFELATVYSAKARGVLDISASGVIEFRRRGADAQLAPLTFLSSLAVSAPSPIASRSIDVLFMGYNSPRRERFFAASASRFSQMATAFIFGELSEPRHASTPGYYSGVERAALLADTKIVLNIHATDYPYFETHRALLAFGNGCVLLSEPCEGMGAIDVGEQMVTASLDRLAEECERLLANPVALQRVADNGLAFAHDAREATHAYVRILAWLTTLDTADAVATDDRSRRLAVSGRLLQAKAASRAGRPVMTTYANSSYELKDSPAVSVLVTVFNYESFVEECLASVLASDPVPGGVELVVVDDDSTDGSLETVRRMVKDGPLPALVISKSTNTGLADARNTGLRHARGRYVFVLDADNWIYPSCLRILNAELSRGDVAAVFSLIRRFDHESGEPLGLISAYDWSSRRLVRGPYIDAMAMFDRQSLEAVGGYSDELIEHGWFGWEDYDLWLKFCASNLSARLVPGILSSYRSHPASMIRRTNRSSKVVAKYFAKKFADLVGRHEGEDRYFGFPRGDLDLAPSVRVVDGEPSILAHCRNLERELAAVYGSKSWKVTAPLRHLFDWLGLSGHAE